MQKKLNKIVNRTNDYLYKYFSKQKKTELVKPMLYGLLPGGKKVRSKILFDIGSIFKIDEKKILHVAAAVECIHAYSLIHDDLPCMDNDNLRRGKLTTHKKFSESTAILAGNSLLTIAFQILSQTGLNLNEQKKIKLINLLSESSGHTGIAGGQFLDLSYEKIKKNKKQIIEMQIKKTGKLFSFCCVAPVIISGKTKYLNKFNKIGNEIGLLFQIADDLIDLRGKTSSVGKKTKKDLKKGKATLISLLGTNNTVKYADNLKLKIFKSLKIFGKKGDDFRETINYILNRTK
ncbi:polyprenyl synthetase family protein [Pelagibacterales bacterium SAG-MED17]|nr:polyprenyl synthetase family protein [Pelagibacterales bacterium SAG-MED17]